MPGYQSYLEKNVAPILSLTRSRFMPSNMKIPGRTFFRIGLIGSMVAALTLIHYNTAPDDGIRHVIFRELYFLPIILSGFWFGLRGGLTTALAISILYGPLVFMGPEKLSPHYWGNIMEIFLFNLVGGLLGWLRDREIDKQEQLREAENLAAMGRATAMIAHDLKTPLITIAGLARRLTGKIPSGTPEGEKILVIRQQANRLEELVMDMLFFARPIQLARKETDLNHLLVEASKAVSGTAQTAKVLIELPTGASHTCSLDREKMLLVFINLLSNAIEASPSGATVSVTVQRHQVGLSIAICDRGEGIPVSLREKIFEPFVSGKKGGTGLGLPICMKIVSAHAGKLDFSRNPTGGTTFRIILPQD